MRYESGYRAGYSLCTVDATGADSVTIGGVATATVTRSIDGDAPPIDSASVDVVVASPSEMPSEGQKVRLYLNATTETDYARTPIVTAVVSDVSVRHAVVGYILCSATLKSVLGVMEDTKLNTGWYCPKGADGAQVADELMRSVLDGSVAVSVTQGDRPILAENYVAGSEESYLKASWGILRPDWQLTLTPMGNVVLRPVQTTVGAIRESMVCSDVSEKYDDSKEARIIDYTREYDPSVEVGDMVSVEGFAGVWRVMSQRLSCGCGVTVAETLQEV